MRRRNCNQGFINVQEALTNTVKHGKASKVDLTLRVDKSLIRLEIRDDGVGFNPTLQAKHRSTRHLGLLGMQERVNMLGGEFKLTSQEAKGTVISVSIPLQASDKTLELP